MLGAVGTPSLLRADNRPADGDGIGHAPAVAETWDMSWTSRVTGKYKAVFDSPEASEGAAVLRAASQIAKKESLGHEAARSRAKAMLLPGVILQPNGVFAALRAQEAGCSYIDAS